MNAPQVYTITVEGTGESFRCASDRTILKAMESLGRKGIPVGCRGGGCGICRVLIVQGQVESRHMSRTQVTLDDEGSGIVLACKAKPLNDVRLRPLGMKAFGECAPPAAVQPVCTVAPIDKER